MWCLFIFYVSTKPYAGIDLGIYGWAQIPPPAQVLVAGSLVVGLLLPIPTFIRGLKRLQIQGRGRTAWFALWLIGGPIAFLASTWFGSYPSNSCHIEGNVPDPTQCPAGSPAVVAWGELGVIAFLLLLLFAMKCLILRPSGNSNRQADSCLRGNEHSQRDSNPRCRRERAVS